MRVLVGVIPDAVIPRLSVESLKETVEGKLRNLGIAISEDSTSVLKVEIMMTFKRPEDPCHPATVRADYVRQGTKLWGVCRSANVSPPHLSEIDEVIDKCMGEFLSYLLHSRMGG